MKKQKDKALKEQRTRDTALKADEDALEDLMCHRVQNVCRDVVRFCKQTEGIWILYWMAKWSTQQLILFEKEHLDWLKEIAQFSDYWPVLKDTTSANTKQIEAFVKKIHLGEHPESPIRMKAYYSSKTAFMSWAKFAYDSIVQVRCPGGNSFLISTGSTDRYDFLSTPFFRGRINIESTVEASHGRHFSGEEFYRRCIALPDLGSETANKWIPVVKYFVQLLTSGHPEKDTNLRKEAKITDPIPEIGSRGKGAKEAKYRSIIVDAIAGAFITLSRKTPVIP